MKATQVYPKLYGARVQRYHTKSVKDTFCARLLLLCGTAGVQGIVSPGFHKGCC